MRCDERLAVAATARTGRDECVGPGTSSDLDVVVGQRDARDLIHAEAARVGVAVRRERHRMRPRKQHVHLVALSSWSRSTIAMRFGGLTALIDRVTTSVSVPRDRQHARRLHLELADDAILPIELHDAVRADERRVPVLRRPARRRCSAAWRWRGSRASCRSIVRTTGAPPCRRPRSSRRPGCRRRAGRG